MTRDELDTLWHQAQHESIAAGEIYIRYHFAELVAKTEREAVLNVLWEYAGRKDLSDDDQSLLKHLVDIIRARGQV